MANHGRESCYYSENGRCGVVDRVCDPGARKREGGATDGGWCALCGGRLITLHGHPRDTPKRSYEMASSGPPLGEEDGLTLGSGEMSTHILTSIHHASVMFARERYHRSRKQPS